MYHQLFSIEFSRLIWWYRLNFYFLFNFVFGYVEVRSKKIITKTTTAAAANCLLHWVRMWILLSVQQSKYSSFVNEQSRYYYRSLYACNMCVSLSFNCFFTHSLTHSLYWLWSIQFDAAMNWEHNCCTHTHAHSNSLLCNCIFLCISLLNEP